ncbi:response regulator transcription factor [Parapedobacter sp. ISTM3]|uniref:DNA-binding response regulator, OmpR family, contains REC and winged-helix (WHTH) domain n=1 Tax=Parapedobacter luteus TaxID=623280 RepID=A0A1T5FB31_9SPHI|nr:MULTISPECIES: response regulator transcription factor [Parapedobacter]MBK1442101.1 response regulator transcription factor [Parapedobacter sp. ISTM3]SKB93354.1 DNA-binding response regulator, OmpR family, contains REC and winged-helix (wHTH) domain [Parapedobacter luteus]
MNILLIEDDSRISDFVVKGLEEVGYSTALATSAEAARELVNTHDWDVILMDIMLPGIDGVQLTKLIRYRRNQTPILVISALDGPDDKVNALDSGADDYLVKPFHFKELLSRINALVRRSKLAHQSDSKVYRSGSLTVNTAEHAVRLGEDRVELSPKEYKLLLYFLEHPGRVLPRAQLLHAVWGIDYDNSTNVVDVYISYLRAKIERGGVKFIHTIKGTGYLWKEPL